MKIRESEDVGNLLASMLMYSAVPSRRVGKMRPLVTESFKSKFQVWSRTFKIKFQVFARSQFRDCQSEEAAMAPITRSSLHGRQSQVGYRDLTLALFTDSICSWTIIKKARIRLATNTRIRQWTTRKVQCLKTKVRMMETIFFTIRMT